MNKETLDKGLQLAAEMEGIDRQLNYYDKLKNMEVSSENNKYLSDELLQAISHLQAFDFRKRLIQSVTDVCDIARAELIKQKKVAEKEFEEL